MTKRYSDILSLASAFGADYKLLDKHLSNFPRSSGAREIAFLQYLAECVAEVNREDRYYADKDRE